MTKTILVADDSVTIRKVVELTFHDTDIQVESAGNGRDALERIEAMRPDLVLADVMMPGPSGYELCRTVKSSHRPVPVLLLAGTFEPFDPERARECGADGCVVKPFESRALYERVSALLADSPPAPAEPADSPAADVEAILDELAAAAGPPAASQPGPGVDSPALEPLDWLLTTEELSSVAAPAAEPAETAAPPSPGEASGALRGEAAEPTPVPRGPLGLSAEDLDVLARAVAARLTEQVIREIAWEVVPDLAESIIRERIRQLEQAGLDEA